MITINESFQCFNCWFEVPKSKSWCRNHCPKCFASLHLDENIPWDRKSVCWWKMFPSEYVLTNWKIKIKFVCKKCKKIHNNKSNIDDEITNLDKFILEYKKFV